MKKTNLKLIFLLFLLCISNSCFSQSYEKTLDCEEKALQQFQNERSSCSGLAQNRLEHSKCNNRAFNNFTINSCSRTLKAAASSIDFLYKELIFNDIKEYYGNLNMTERNNNYLKIRNIIDDEMRNIIRGMMTEIDNKAEIYQQARNQSLISNSINLLGGKLSQPMQNSNAPFTFIFNNRAIVCTPMGMTTVCN